MTSLLVRRSLAFARAAQPLLDRAAGPSALPANAGVLGRLLEAARAAPDARAPSWSSWLRPYRGAAGCCTPDGASRADGVTASSIGGLLRIPGHRWYAQGPTSSNREAGPGVDGPTAGRAEAEEDGSQGRVVERAAVGQVDAVMTLPNALSLGRALAGPLLALWVLHGQHDAALAGLVLASATDWLDGYLAKAYHMQSTFGSYLDPLADKILITCLAGAEACSGLLEPALFALFVARDVALFAGAASHRGAMLHWRWPGFAEFFRTTRGAGGATAIAPAVDPLPVSKLNTVLQLMAIAGALALPACGAPPTEALQVLGAMAAATTVASTVAYAKEYREGRLFPNT